MKLTKEECESAFKKIEKHFEENELIEAYEDELGAIYFALEQHFDNPPLKWEELKEGMWVWDNLKKEFIQIEYLDDIIECKYLNAYTVPSNEYERIYSNNRFYRREVQDERNI